MNKPLIALLSRLTYGDSSHAKSEDVSFGVVETLARVYERARNALEYRADNLVRRAAIERILKRQMVLSKNTAEITHNLLTELKWARYLSVDDTKAANKRDLEMVVNKYTSYQDGVVPLEWIAKIASAEIEEHFNLNIDYRQFTFFAFQVVKQKIVIEDPNIDLLIYFAVDKIYAGSDDEQVAYHIMALAGEPFTKEKFQEAWKLFSLARVHRELPRIIKFVRRQMPPLVLLRDIYFYSPSDFKKEIAGKEKFITTASDVLELQLKQMSGRVTTAGIRSVLYVFLTKMVLAFGVEVPFEIFFLGTINKLPLAINLVFPPLLMWATTMQIKLPGKRDKERLVERTWYILENFDKLADEEDLLRAGEAAKQRGLGYQIFSAIYGVFFVAVFAAIVFILGKIGYTIFSEIIFIFFLTIIAFFAYRISQIAKIYLWKNGNPEGSTLFDIITLPILAIGSRLSQGISKLNFLAFAFDFILEAPFKLILGFVDRWVQFLSVKKEEQIIE